MSVQTSIDLILKVGGLDCEEAGLDLQQTLLKISGVHQVRVETEFSEVMLQYDPSVTSFDQIISSLEDAGFQAEVIEV